MYIFVDLLYMVTDW